MARQGLGTRGWGLGKTGGRAWRRGLTRDPLTRDRRAQRGLL